MLRTSQDSFKFYIICTWYIIFIVLIRRESTIETRCCRRKLFLPFSPYTSYTGTVAKLTNYDRRSG